MGLVHDGECWYLKVYYGRFWFVKENVGVAH